MLFPTFTTSILTITLWIQSGVAFQSAIFQPQFPLASPSIMPQDSNDVLRSVNSISKGITPEQIASAEKIDEDPKLSKDGARVVYSAGPAYKTGDHMTSAIWIAETFQEGSARQLTDGAYRDYSPSFHPTSSRIFFLSDREDAGGLAQLFSLPPDGSAENIIRITNLDKEHGAASYAISPNGNFIAVVVEASKSKKGEKETITIWREEKKEKYSTLQLINLREPLGLSTGARTLVSVDAHVESFSWSPNSSAIIYRLVDHRDIEAEAFPIKEQIVLITGESSTFSSFTYPRMPSSPTIWRPAGDFIFVQVLEPSKESSANCVWSRKSAEESQSQHLAYGGIDDVGSIVDLGIDSQYAVQVVDGLLTRFDVYDRDNNVFTAFQTTIDVAVDGGWDMKLTSEGKYVFIAIRSSGVRGEPENIWSGVTERNQSGVLTKKLSSHNSWFDSETAPIVEPFYWTGSDGVKLEGVISYPTGVEPKGLPTLVNPHGGPSSRDTLSLNLGFNRWRPFLASHGYLVISPNYRGSTGRGNDFALAAQGGVGTVDWDDINTMIEAGILRGLIDPQRVGIGGWSQGGYETAWGCTRPGNKFKVGIMGAGVSDWGFMAASSDVPDFEAALGGGGPWTPGKPLYLSGSPIKDVQNVVASILILHGKEDARVPVTQAIAFLRGIERVGQATVNPTLAIYPREEHGFKERSHAEDVLQRVLEYVDLYLK